MTPRSARRPAVHLQRVIPASPEQVYRAWLEPEILRQWLAPGDLEVTRVEVDERVGGTFRVWQGSKDQEAGGIEGQIVELVPNRRITLRWGFVGPARMDGPTFDSLLTISLSDSADRGTTLTLVHEELDALWEAMPQVAENVEQGWELVFQKLTRVADGAPAR
jgi:uncharacterized protein YndB with AHSA1/START domain